MHATQYNCCSAPLSTYFLLNHASQKLQAKYIDYKIQGVIQQRECESWVKKTEEIKQWLVELWQCTSTASEKCIFCFPFCQVMQKHNKLFELA